MDVDTASIPVPMLLLLWMMTRTNWIVKGRNFLIWVKRELCLQGWMMAKGKARARVVPPAVGVEVDVCVVVMNERLGRGIYRYTCRLRKYRSNISIGASIIRMYACFKNLVVELVDCE